MADIRVRFKRVAEAFDGMARARLCESSGSEHSPENYSLDLSDIVESFFEREGREEGENGDDNGTEVDSLENETKRGECDDQEENDRSESESMELLRGLLFGGGDQGDDDQVKESVRAAVERASRVDGPERPGFKRRVMTRLRERGFDAGLCKSKWERNGRVPSGSYEYIDVNVAGGTRYIIELSLPGEFTIARPTPKYTSLLQNFPPIFVGKVEDLKQIVRLMSNEIKGSLKKVDMHVPPWRRHVYMQAKWFGSYKRTTNEVVEKMGLGSDAGSGKKRWVGFAPVPGVSYCCRKGFGGKGGVKMGKLAMEFIGNGACVTVNSSIVD
ncbi:hypothetical protein RHMOL_Rhmol02G0113500 [Rhododendron molle]|uniref:Uncharacterized protein n=1 Tax=Rhododendron molle TaxID=49168 RepID=A0ACC0PQC6_RHOML|nr:hypothetical protein RHMOL_Rhmol02G0113500 [Rhododendron molle]